MQNNVLLNLKLGYACLASTNGQCPGTSFLFINGKSCNLARPWQPWDESLPDGGGVRVVNDYVMSQLSHRKKQCHFGNSDH
jgi:hypothetical protein